MPEYTDHWLWFVDEELVDRLMAPDEVAPNASIRPAEAAAAGIALDLQMQGRTDEAASEVERALESGEPAADLYAIAGSLRFQLADYNKAAEHFGKLRKIAPDHPTAGFNLGVCYERLGKYELAIEAFTTAAARHNQLWQAHVGLGYCHLRLGQFDRALQAFQDTLELQPGAEKAIFGMAVALQSLGKLDQAEDVYARLLPAHADNVEMLTNLIALAAGRQDALSLRECSKHLLHIQPDSRIGIEGLLTVAFAEQDYAQAVELSTRLTNLAPEDFRAWYNLGLSCQKLNRMEDAGEAYHHAIRIEPKAAQAHANLGNVLQERGDFAGAKASYEEALTLRPAPDRLWNLALACEQLNEPEEAELAYEQMVEIRRDWAEAWFRLGAIRYDRLDTDRALDAFESAAAAKANWSEALLNVGVCQYKLSRYQEALISFERVVQDSPTNVHALTGLAAAATAINDAKMALKAYRDLQAAGGQPSPELTFNVGLALQKNGMNAEAIECYRAALASRPEFVQANINLGHALNALDQSDLARQHWARAAEVAPHLAAM